MGLTDTIRERIRLARLAHEAQVEDSVLPRVATVTTVVVALLAVGLSGVVPVPEVAASLVLVVVGNALSHRRRRSDNRLIKVLIVVAVVVVLGRFFQQLGSAQTLDDARQPLATMFLGIQTLHAFDLPRTRDLTFTVSASMALVALATAATRSPLFLALVVLWLLLAATSLWLVRQAETARRGGRTLSLDDLRPAWSGSGSRRSPAARALPLGGLAVATMLVFLALPRPEVGTTISLPFEQLRQGVPSPGGVTNPGLPASDPGGGDPDTAFDPVAYFGLSDTVDIRTAGRLSDQLVMRVRTSRPRLLRGLVFDHYEDNRWTRTAEEPPPRQGLPVRLDGQPGDRQELSQTIEVVTATPNLVFAAGAPLDLYHASRSARQWSDGTVTVATTQEPGTVYSVISDVPVASEAELRRSFGQPPERVTDRYLQTPALTDRTVALSTELVDPAASNYANAESVMSWIGDNVAYSLDLEDHPPDQDAVDTLLFERRLGWCEPISASMVMLLRAGGVPARWVTGFQPGDHDVFTGFWEVRARDAHAWVEVWVPDQGWLSFDPTGAVPNADGPASTGVSIPLLALAGDALDQLAGVSTPVWLALLLALGVLVALAREAWLRHIERAPLEHLPRVTREPWETPTDLADRLHRDRRAPGESLEVLVGAHHARTLDRAGPSRAAVRDAHRDVRRAVRRG